MNYEYGKYNLHTHSVYCGHGVGKLEEYVSTAKEIDLELLGFSEHCPVKENRWKKSRMDYSLLDIYLDDINSLKVQESKAVEKYDKAIKQDKMDQLFLLKKSKNPKKEKTVKILSGFECDYFKEYHSYYQELKEKCDYLIFGVHYLDLPTYKDFPLHHYPLDKKSLSVYADQYIKSLESNLFSIAAHPDLFFIQYFKWDEQSKAVSKEIIEAAIYYNVPLEVNGNGILKEMISGFNGEMRYLYPVKEFWDLAKSYDKIQIIANADAHNPYFLDKSLNKCKEFATELNIKYASANVDEVENKHKVNFI